VQLSVKVEGSQAEALTSYLSIVNEMSQRVYFEYPETIRSYATELSNYYDQITGKGFTKKIRSSKPGVEEDYCHKLKNTHAEDFLDQAKAIKTKIDTIMDDSDAAAVITGDPITA